MSFALLVIAGAALGLLIAAAAVGYAAFRLERDVDAERRPRRASDRAAPRSGDLTLLLRYTGKGAETVGALVAEHAPHGIVPPSRVTEVARRLSSHLGAASHGEAVFGAHRVLPVRDAPEGGLLLCFRAQVRSSFEIPPSPIDRRGIARVLEAIAGLEATDVVSGDLLLAERSRRRHHPSLHSLGPVVIDEGARG